MTRLSIRFVFPLLFLLVAGVAVYVLLSLHTSGRHIGFNGSFVLVDQKRLFRKVERLSEDIDSTDKFISAVRDILAEESYIESHSVRLSWPNKVVINIEEIEPVAILNGNFLFTGTCGSFRYTGNIRKPGILSIRTKLDVRDLYLCDRVRDISSAWRPSNIDSVEVLNNGNYVIQIAGVDYLVSGESVSADMLRLKKISERLSTTDMKIASVDLRYTSGGAVKLL